MAKGRKTGGRRPGVPNKRTVARKEALATAAGDLRSQLDAEAAKEANAPSTATPAAPLPDWWRGDAHALLRWVYCNPEMPMEMRLDAAKSAVRFERPALVASHIQHSAGPSKQVLANLTTQQLRELLASMDENAANGLTVDGNLLPGPDAEDD